MSIFNKSPMNSIENIRFLDSEKKSVATPLEGFRDWFFQVKSCSFCNYILGSKISSSTAYKKKKTPASVKIFLVGSFSWGSQWTLEDNRRRRRDNWWGES